MTSATEIVISGCSAGGIATLFKYEGYNKPVYSGLGVYLGIDPMRDQILESNAAIKVRAMSDSGYFLSYSSDENWITEK